MSIQGKAADVNGLLLNVKSRKITPFISRLSYCKQSFHRLVQLSSCIRSLPYTITPFFLTFINLAVGHPAREVKIRF